MNHWDAHITPMLVGYERFIEYSFPDTAPDYDTFGITGWGQATEEMKIATHDIFVKLEDILDIKFKRFLLV